MKIRLYNHHYLTDDGSWVYIFMDQMKQLEDFGLYDEMEVLSYTALGNQEQIKLFKDLCALYSKIEIHEIHNDVTGEELKDFSSAKGQEQNKFVFEIPTIKRMWLDAQTQDFYGLYFHGKGVTAFNNAFKVGDVAKFKNYYYWRKYLEYGFIERWKTCVQALEQYETAGINLNHDPFLHYSGNFWWLRSDYMRTLDDIEDSQWWKENKQPYHLDRMIAEFWPLSKANKIFNIDSPPPRLCSPNPGLYSETYMRKYYDRALTRN